MDILNELRQRVPVGMKRGLEVLAQTNGDVDQAERIIKADFVQIVVSKTTIVQDVAEAHLMKANFDIAVALQSIDQERFSLTERILKKHKNKEEAFARVALAIAEVEQLENRFWLNVKSLPPLNPSLRCFLIVNEWLSYESYEGLEIALYFQLDETTEQIEQQLLLPEVAQTLKTAHTLHQSQQHSQGKKFTKRQTSEFGAISTEFAQQRSQLVDALLNYVQAQIGDFP